MAQCGGISNAELNKLEVDPSLTPKPFNLGPGPGPGPGPDPGPGPGPDPGPDPDQVDLCQRLLWGLQVEPEELMAMTRELVSLP
jgi:hypothetical protein